MNLPCNRLHCRPGMAVTNRAACLPARIGRRHENRLRTHATTLESVVDPNTGLQIDPTSPLHPVSGFQANVKGMTWAYRRSEVDSSKKDPNKPWVVLLHGIGSCSYSYRNLIPLLGAEGYNVVAPDWIGHGDSDKPTPGSSFDYSSTAYVNGLHDFIKAAGVPEPYALVVQGFVLGQYGLLYALQHEAEISRLLILNTPVGLNTKLRPELAAYQSPIPFLRPGNKAFDGTMYNLLGCTYTMEARDGEVYGKAYNDPAASRAIAATMDKVNWSKLLQEVNEGYKSWRKPSVLLFGANDPFVELSTAFDFLETKRTNMKVSTIPAKVGHMPQEDFADALKTPLVAFLKGDSDQWKNSKGFRMTKYGMTEN